MRWLDEIIPQDVEGIRGNDWHIRTSTDHDKDSRRNQHYDYGDGRNNSEG